MIKVYSLSYNEKRRSWCNLVSLDKTALEEYVSKNIDSNDKFERREITVREQNGYLYEDRSSSCPYTRFIKGEAVLVGKRHVDARCTGMEHFYTVPSRLEEAQAQFKQEEQEQQKRSDSYYSAIWV